MFQVVGKRPSGDDVEDRAPGGARHDGPMPVNQRREYCFSLPGPRWRDNESIVTAKNCRDALLLYRAK